MPFASYQAAAGGGAPGRTAGSGAAELGRQQVAEELVDAVPAVIVVDPVQEEVLALDLVEASCRVGALEHGVAQRRARAGRARTCG